MAGSSRNWVPTIRWCSNTDERVKLNLERVDYWMGVGALPSENVAVLVKKYRKKLQKQAVAAPETPAAPTAPTA